MKKTVFLTLFLIFLSFQLEATKIKGFVTDASNSPLPFATIYVKGANLTTTTNEDGFFSLTLDKGSYFILFRHIGFEEIQIKVEVGDENIDLQVQLKSQSLQLQEVVITTTDQDPAYAIIRKAQEKRKYYLNEEVKSFQCNAYIKGLQRIVKRPNRILGTKITLDTGVVYFSESFSELAYKQPNFYKERMLSSKVSGRSQAFSFNQASESWINLYQNIIGEVGLGDRGFVSPIANNAFSYYRFRLEGVFYENNQLINKIRLIPKRKNAPAFAGYIYIIEDSWRLHSTELYVPKGTVEFVDSVSIKQVYLPSPTHKDIWLPASQKADFGFKAFGIVGKGYFIFIFSNYTLEPAFPKKTFNKEVFVVEKDANKRDTTYWEKLRPIPLTQDERKEYKVKDSLEVIKESKPYKDSVDKTNNKYTFGSFIFGYTYRDSFRKQAMRVPGLLNLVQYNTIEGWVANGNANFRQNYENRTYFNISPTVRYGFANHRWQGKLEANYLFNVIKRANIGIEGGQFVEQISRQNSITPFANALYSLAYEENYLKLYEKKYLRLNYSQELINGVYFSGFAEWAARSPMQNNSNFTFFDYQDKVFTTNTPINAELANTDFNTHQAMIVGVNLVLRFGQKYATYPERKFIVSNKSPNIRLGYRKGIPTLLSSDIDYDLAVLGINDDLNLGLLGTLSYDAEAGTFLRSNRMYFIDYRHFLGNQVLFIQQDLRNFHLLDYYTFSTAKSYAKAHIEHHFNGFLTNSIPLLRKLRWHLITKFNYLYTPTLNHYAEAVVGLEKILKIIRADFVLGFQQNRPIQTGFRFSFGF